MPTQCRAKDPNSCRVHGSGGKLEFLQQQADHYLRMRNMSAYIAIKADIDKLADEDEPKPSFEGMIAPDTGNLIVGNWKDENGQVIAEAPNDMLLSNLSQSSVQSMPDTERIKEILRSRGYNENDLFMTKHFHFKKDDPDSKDREITQMEVIRASMDIENKHGVKVDPHDRDQVIERHFYYIQYDTTATKSRCKKFIEDYENYAKSLT